MIERDFLYVGGEWIEPASGQTTEVIYPFTEEPIGRAALAGSADVDRAVRAARAAFDDGPWPRATAAERAAVLRRAGEQIEARADELAQLTTLEVGSPIAGVGLQVDVAKLFLDWHADQAETYPWEEERPGVFSSLLVRREPVGVVGAIVPWNVPLGSRCRSSAPRCSPAAPSCSSRRRRRRSTRSCSPRSSSEAGLPARRPQHRARRPRGRASTSSATRCRQDRLHRLHARREAAIGAICGEQLKRCTLELGGKSAAIILDDADLDAVIAGARCPRRCNNGQACVAQTRILAPRGRYDEVVEALTDDDRRVRGRRPRRPGDRRSAR